MKRRLDFQRIRIGDTVQRLKELAGEPESISALADCQCWYYRKGEIAVYLGGAQLSVIKKLIIDRKSK